MPDYEKQQKEADIVDDLEAKLKEEKAKRKQQLTINALEEFVTQTQFFYVSEQDKYFMHYPSGAWTYVSPDALKRSFSLFIDKAARDALTVVLEDHGRIFDNINYTFTPNETPRTLNLLDVSKWVKPAAGAYHWLFDMLIYAMGGAKPKNIEHIERLIAYKFKHPNCPTLPALIVHGEGSVGKNLLVELVLRTLFDGATISGNVDTMLGHFMTPLVGKVVVLIDEASAKKVNHDKLKNRLGSTSLIINEKGLKEYETPAISWNIISSNKHEGGIFLDRSSADRRYSVCYVEAGKDLHRWIGEKLDISNDAAAIWVKMNAPKILTDKNEVGHWIHALIAKYEGQEQPLAFHGEDFERMLDVQQPVEEALIPDVFNDPDFTHINRSTLYEGYKLLCKRDERFALSSRFFYAKVRAWLKANKTDIQPDEFRQRQQDYDNQSEKDQTTNWIWCVNTAKADGTIKKPNSDRYLNTSDRYQALWVGPEGK